MKIAIFGANCTAHYLAQTFESDPLVDEIFIYNASPNIIKTNKCTPVAMSKDGNFNDYKTFFFQEVEQLTSRNIDLVIDTTLMTQLWKELRTKLANTGIPLLIPPAKSSFLEWSKKKSKALFQELKIPTPLYQSVTVDTVIKNFKEWPRPYVLKFDQDYREGLQTLVITDSNVNECYDEFLINGSCRVVAELGEFVDQVFVKEEFVHGREYSYHVLCNGKTPTFLGAARDYKKRYNSDTGFNTVGMGSYSPVDDVDHTVLNYAQKILNYLTSQGIEFKGIMYLGVLVNEAGIPLLLEVNTRPGDPEFSTIVPTIEDSLAKLFYDAATGADLKEVKFNNKSSTTVRIVRTEYGLHSAPDFSNLRYKNVPPDITVSYANGFKNFNSMVSATGKSIDDSADKIYKFLNSVDLEGFTYRTDIGYLK